MGRKVQIVGQVPQNGNDNAPKGYKAEGVNLGDWADTLREAARAGTILDE